jgi:segregation and condensation protein B
MAIRVSEQATAQNFVEAVRLAEAVIFAATQAVTARTLVNLLPEETDVDAVMAALAENYAARGVNLVEVGGGYQFRTAPDIAPVLRKVVELPRRLPRVAMETLAIVAYHQPVTRTEIEEIRGAALSQTTLDLLLENGLVTPKGRRESPGRPTLWGTTPAFLAQFGLNDLRDLPKREELLIDPSVTLTPVAEFSPPSLAGAPADPPAGEAAAPDDGAVVVATENFDQATADESVADGAAAADDGVAALPGDRVAVPQDAGAPADQAALAQAQSAGLLQDPTAALAHAAPAEAAAAKK